MSYSKPVHGEKGLTELHTRQYLEVLHKVFGGIFGGTSPKPADKPQSNQQVTPPVR